MRLPDCGFNYGRTACEEEVSHFGAFCGQRSIVGERVIDISEPKHEISQTEQTLAAHSLGREYCDSRSKGGSDSGRFRSEDAY